MFETEFGELTPGRRQHAARDLMAQVSGIEVLRCAEGQILGARQPGKVARTRGQQAIVDVDRVTEFAQVGHHAFRIRQ